MYSPDMAEVIAEKLKRQSLRRICSEEDMPDRSTVERWMQDDPEFAAKCARSRDIYADHMFDGMEDIEDRVLSGEIDAAAARTVLSSQQWRASKISRKYGDKMELGGALNLNTKIERITRKIIDPQAQ